MEQTEAVQTIEDGKQVFALHGLVALFLFLIIYVEYGRRFDAGSGKPYLALPAPLGEGFQMMGLLAAGTVPAVAGLVLLLCSGESRGLLREISAMILLLAACIVWIWIVGKWIQNLTRFYIQHLPAGIDKSVVLPGFRGYCSLHSGIKIRALPLSGGNLSMEFISL